MGNLLFILIPILFIASSAIKIVNEYERLVVFRFGRLVSSRGPGIRFIIPFVEKAVRIDIRTITMDVPPQDIITRDNVSVKVNAVVYYRVIDVNKAINEIENYHYATNQLAQTTLRSACGESDLDDLLVNREAINHRLQEILDTHTDPWGIKVSMVEIKHIDLPPEMQRAMAKQAEAERERRAKIIAAEAEFQASQRLGEAANIISAAPGALQLRYLQTLKEIASENNSTTIFPLPIELLTGLMKK
ncbi:MAG TPA: slipin family protein [Oligoflexia bacterium]|nr:slipin family protein [Oligoflexia bacterium]HMP49831.1 slipin family protein [Oligoflexia bacterium]